MLLPNNVPVTNPDLLSRLVDAARNYVMSPAEIRRQRLSWIRGQSGLSDEVILRVLPELRET